MGALITRDHVVNSLPKSIRKSISEEALVLIENALNDPDLTEELRGNILGYVDILQDGRFKVQDYLNAVRYVSYKLLGSTNISAYIKTFPDRYSMLLSNGTSEKDIASHVSAYNKNKLVNLIFEQTLVPTHVLNADLHQQAINVQAELMLYAKSEKVRCDAANSLLTHLKAPETAKIKMDVEVKDSSALSELKELTRQLALQQQQMIMSGAVTAQGVAESKIIEGELVDEQPEDQADC